MYKISSLQDPFLNALRKEKVQVAVYLVNGIKLQGLVEAFDQLTIILRSNVNQMVYKHAISTIVPTKSIRLVYNSSNSEQSQAKQIEDTGKISDKTLLSETKSEDESN